MTDKEKVIHKIRRLKRSIKDNPAVRGKYDTDGDGKIDVDEWDRAREDVLKYVASEDASGRQKETAGTAAVVAQESDDAGVESQEAYSEWGPLRVESFWGAIAMFCLCQIYFFILFEGFVFVSGAPATHRKILYVWFGVLFLVSVSAQIEALIKIENYLSGKPFKTNAFHIASAEDFIKCLLAIILGLFFILFCFGFYPFPSKPHQWWHTLVFFFIIWCVSAAAAKNLRGGIKSTQPLGLMNAIPVIMGFTFFTVGAFLGEVFYFAGTFGMGFALIPIRPLLLCNQTRLLKQKNMQVRRFGGL